MYASVGAVSTLGVSSVWNQAIIGIRPRVTADRRFVAYWLRHYAPQAVAEAKSATQANLNAEQVANFPFPDSAIAEQRRIADFLDDRVSRIDQIITARSDQISALELGYAAWLGSFIDALGTMHGWAPLRRFDARIEQGWSPEADSVPAIPGQPGVLKLGAVRGGFFDAAQNKAFLDTVSPREAWRIAEGDLLVTRANTPSLVGDAAVAENVDAAVYLSDLIYRLRSTRYGALLASAALRSPRARQLISVVARGTSGSMPKLRGEDILALPVPAAPLGDHAGLGLEDKERRRERDERTAQLRHAIKLATEYKQSLVTAAVTGELDVTTAGSGIQG